MAHTDVLLMSVLYLARALCRCVLIHIWAVGASESALGCSATTKRSCCSKLHCTV